MPSSMPFLPSDHLQNRRAFLRRSGQLALTGTALPFALNLAAMGEAAAFNSNPGDANDYKALVCVFLYGGNDYANTVVSYDDASYNAYAGIRGGLALPKGDLGGTLLRPYNALPGGRQYALHPSMGAMANLFNSGKAAVQLNVGPLVAPLTRAQYEGSDRRTYPVPPKLFSHNDQQSIWQSSSPEGSTVGWGGNIADLALGGNPNAMFTCMSITGNAVFLSGDNALSYQVSTGGAVAINGIKNSVYGSSAVQGALSAITQQPRSHLLENEYNRVTKRAIGAETQISSALGKVNLGTAFPSGNPLADQLKMVARLIGARSDLGTRRQVFLVSLGGFDLHDNLIAQHGGLLGKVSDAMSAFYSATTELGVADKVTSFTASDFGRTLSSNGDGSDHGWGSHHFVMGGAVKGAAFYGSPPPVSVGNSNAPDDQFHVGSGRLLPTTSVDQYAATMASWFGVAGSGMPGDELASVLPNITRFGAAANRPDYPVNLGFL
jgi:uncharacterized protein (DUF1501 family)